MKGEPGFHALVAALAVALGTAGGAGSARQQPTFRAKVNVVAVDVSVTRGHTPVAGLKAANFEVRDNGVRQAIDRLMNEELPLDASLVLDVSGSVRGAPMARLQQAATRFVGALQKRDRAALVTFSHEIAVRQDVTSDREAVLRAIASMEAGGTTALYDAAYVALRSGRRTEGRRSVAVVLTDGADNASWLTADRVLEAVERSDTIVYGVAVHGGALPGGAPGSAFDTTHTSQSSPLSGRRFGFLREAGAASGGRVLDSSWSGLEETFAEILRQVRARHVLWYYPTDTAPGWHTLQVRLVNARGTVTSRRGYWVAPPKS